MGRKALLANDRMTSFSVSMGTKQLDFIRFNGIGATISEKIRYLLTIAERNMINIVSYSDDCTEVMHQQEGSFLIFRKTDDSFEYGSDLPFSLPARAHVEDCQRVAILAGYSVQVVERKEIGFIAVWASKANDYCKKCRETTINTIVSKVKKA